MGCSLRDRTVCTSIRFLTGSDGECFLLNERFNRSLLPTRLEAKLCAAAQPYKGKWKPLPNKILDDAPRDPQARRYVAIAQGTYTTTTAVSVTLIDLAFGAKPPTASD
jgi:hypothetical protein